MLGGRGLIGGESDHGVEPEPIGGERGIGLGRGEAGVVGFELCLKAFVGVVFEEHGVGEGVEERELRVIGVATLIEAEFGEEVAFVKGVSIGDKGAVEIDLDIGMDLVVALGEEEDDGASDEKDHAKEKADEKKSLAAFFVFAGFEGGVYVFFVALWVVVGEFVLGRAVAWGGIGRGAVAEIIGDCGSSERCGRSGPLEAAMLFGRGCLGRCGIAWAVHFPLFGRLGGLEILEFGPIGHGAPKLAIIGELFAAVEFAVLEHMSDLRDRERAEGTARATAEVVAHFLLGGRGVLLIEFIKFAVEVSERVIVCGSRSGSAGFGGRGGSAGFGGVCVGLSGKVSEGVIKRRRSAGEARDIGESEVIEVAVGIDQFLIGGEVLCEGIFLWEFEFKPFEVGVGARWLGRVTCRRSAEEGDLSVFVEVEGLLAMTTGCA